MKRSRHTSRSAGPPPTRRRRWRAPGWALGVLIVLHGVALLAELLAPHAPHHQDRYHPHAPPTPPRWIDADGAWHWPPFVHPLEPMPGTFDQYRVDRTRRIPLELWQPLDEPRHVLGFELRHRLLGVAEPGRLFLLGTDRLGRDLFSRMLHGARISLLAGLFAGCVAVGLGLFFGTLAGMAGGWVDDLIMRWTELMACLPWLYLLLTVRAFLPLDMAPERSFLWVCGLIALLGWGRTARLVRGRSASLRQREFVQAARGFGLSWWRVGWRHVVPQTLPLVLTQLALMVPQLILAEVSLSFFGLGVGEPIPSLGLLLADLRQMHGAIDHWWLALPVVVLLSVVLSYHGVASDLERRLGAVDL